MQRHENFLYGTDETQILSDQTGKCANVRV
jgi:hypothetical protein